MTRDPLFTLDELRDAAALVYRTLPPTPQVAWPLLAARVGTRVWVKHENHTPTGAFKVRGGLVYMDALKRREPEVRGVISATRGNHGQSIALAAAQAGLTSVIYVPHGNAVEKNRAMAAFGAELIEHGRDFDAAKDASALAAAERGLHLVPSFHIDLVRGVATYALELFTALPDLDTVYAPIGMGSGICGLISARDLIGHKARIVGVVAANAPAVALSFAAGRPVPTNTAATFADGMACRDPHPQALAIIRRGAERIVEVAEDEIAEAVRVLFADTHNAAEGAGAAALAALMKEGAERAGANAAIVLSGGNMDSAMFVRVLAGETPAVG